MKLIVASAIASSIVLGFGFASAALLASHQQEAVRERAPVSEPVPTGTSGVVTAQVINVSTGVPVAVSGTWVVTGNPSYINGVNAVGTYRPPRISISCDEDACTARGGTGNMDDAKAMLERIANRSMRIEVSVDQKCHVQRETIEPKQDLVASAN